MTRKLRKIAAHLKKSGELGNEEYKDLRKKIRNKNFKSKAHLKDYIGNKEITKVSSSKPKTKKTKSVKKKK